MSKLDIYLESSDVNDLSIESISVLCIINYCGLKNENLNLYLCFNTENKVSLDGFNEKYKQFYEFLDESNDQYFSNNEILPIYVKYFTHLSSDIKNVSLPCLRIIENNSNGLIVYSGLATLYRAIVSFSLKLKNEKDFHNLLVSLININQEKFFILFFSTRAINKLVSKLVKKSHLGQIYANINQFKFIRKQI
jgi:hypothetical protein